MIRFRLLGTALAVSLLAACGGEPTPQLTTEERLALPADLANGERLFRACAVCHERTQGARHRVGPTLWNVMGEPVGIHDDFAYSRALDRADFIWTDEIMDDYLRDPREVIPGGRMAYEGEPDPANRRDLIAYLKTLSGDASE